MTIEIWFSLCFFVLLKILVHLFIGVWHPTPFLGDLFDDGPRWRTHKLALNLFKSLIVVDYIAVLWFRILQRFSLNEHAIKLFTVIPLLIFGRHINKFLLIFLLQSLPFFWDLFYPQVFMRFHEKIVRRLGLFRCIRMLNSLLFLFFGFRCCCKKLQTLKKRMGIRYWEGISGGWWWWW